MRMSFEVLAGEVDTRELTNRKSGETEKVSILNIHGIDSDFPQSMYKLQVWREFEKVKNSLIRGTVLQLKFNSIKPADGRYEKVPVITMPQEDIAILKSAEQALRELQQSIDNHSQPEKETQAA